MGGTRASRAKLQVAPHNQTFYQNQYRYFSKMLQSTMLPYTYSILYLINKGLKEVYRAGNTQKVINKVTLSKF